MRSLQAGGPALWEECRSCSGVHLQLRVIFSFLKTWKGGDSRGKTGRPGKSVCGFQGSFSPGQVLWLVLEMWRGGLCATMKGRRDLPLGHCSVEEESPAFSGLRLGSWRGDALGDDQGNEKAPGPGPHQHLPLRQFPEAWVGKHEHIQQRQQTGLRLRRGWSLGRGILPF